MTNLQKGVIINLDNNFYNLSSVKEYKNLEDVFDYVIKYETTRFCHESGVDLSNVFVNMVCCEHPADIIDFSHTSSVVISQILQTVKDFIIESVISYSRHHTSPNSEEVLSLTYGMLGNNVMILNGKILKRG